MLSRKKDPQRLVKVIERNGILKFEEFQTSDDIQNNVLRASFNGAYKYCHDMGIKGKQIVYVYRNLTEVIRKIKEKNTLPDYFKIKNGIVFYKPNDMGKYEANGVILKWEKIPIDDVKNRFDKNAAKEAFAWDIVKQKNIQPQTNEHDQILNINTKKMIIEENEKSKILLVNLTDDEERKYKKQKYDSNSHPNNKISIINLCEESDIESTTQKLDVNNNSGFNTTLFRYHFNKKTIALMSSNENSASIASLTNDADTLSTEPYDKAIHISKTIDQEDGVSNETAEELINNALSNKTIEIDFNLLFKI